RVCEFPRPRPGLDDPRQVADGGRSVVGLPAHLADRRMAALARPAPARPAPDFRMRFAGFKQVDRLVGVSVLSAVALTWFVLVGFDAFSIFVGELNDVGRGTYTLAKAASYTLLTLPRRLYEMFGYAALIGGLAGLGGLAGSGELTALRAAGMSKLRICASVVLTLTLLT